MGLWMLALLVACGDGEDETDAVDTDVETDTDVDTDTDSDTDTDTDTDTAPGELIIDVETTLGAFAVRLDADNAPVTTANFLAYVDEGFYDGDDGLGATLFHRVIADFVTQGGGVTAAGQQKATHAPIVLESQNGLSNLRGTIAMARTSVPDSATSQFYVNLTDDNTFLDYTNEANPGYAVFGEVIEGMATIDAIAAVQVNSSGKPTTDVVITDCERR